MEIGKEVYDDLLEKALVLNPIYYEDLVQDTMMIYCKRINKKRSITDISSYLTKGLVNTFLFKYKDVEGNAVKFNGVKPVEAQVHCMYELWFYTADEVADAMGIKIAQVWKLLKAVTTEDESDEMPDLWSTGSLDTEENGFYCSA